MIRASLIFAVTMLATTLPNMAAHACNGINSDPINCINNNQAVDGFGPFHSNNLQGLPEVTSFNPGYKNLDSSFVLTFSEPMDPATLEDNFVIREFPRGGGQSDRDRLFSRRYASSEPANQNVFRGNPENGNVWDESEFDVDWNSDDSEVTFTFENERQLPTDKDTENTPDYLVSLNDDDAPPAPEKFIDKYFDLDDADFDTSHRFTVQSESDSPDTTGDTNQQDGTIKIVFTEPKVFYAVNDPLQGRRLNPRVEGETVANLEARVGGESVPIRIIRTDKGQNFALDPDTGHNYGSIHPSRSGFGWSFDGTPVPKPSTEQPSLSTRVNRAIAEADQSLPFSDGFESGNTSAWTTSGN